MCCQRAGGAEAVETSTLFQEEILEASRVIDEVLQVHGTAPGMKADGVFRLVYENCNGLLNKISDNDMKTAMAC